MSRATASAIDLPRSATAFLMRYVRLRWHAFAALISIVIGAAICAVAVQYGMKLIVDAMAQPNRLEAPIWHLLGWFIGLIAIESAYGGPPACSVAAPSSLAALTVGSTCSPT